jgi:hypothetical protein
MLRLDLSNNPRWLDMPGGVRIQCLPYSTDAMIDAQSDPEVLAVDPALSTRRVGAVVAKAIARRVIVAWEGVGDAAGEPIEPSPAAIDQLMNIWPIFEAFQAQYVSGLFALSAEGNGSTPSPNGSSAGAQTTARPARSRAKPARAS